MDRARAAVRERDQRVAALVGRTARLELVFEKRRGRTIVAHAYCEPPFRIGRCLELDDAAYVIVVCAGPGVFAGDVLRQSVHVRSGARVVLTSQSALQVHPSASPQPAILEHVYELDDDAELHGHWDPVIPFAGARLAQRFDLGLAESARLWWSDAVMAGRISRGEAWRFHELAHELRLQIGGTLMYLERYRLTPAERPLDRRWMAGAATYLATALVRHDRATSEAAQALHDALGAFEGTRAAADLVEPRLLVARLMAADGASFAAARAASRRVALDTIFQSPRLAGRKSV